MSFSTSSEQKILKHQNRAGLPVSHPTRSFWIDSPGANPLAKEGSTGPLTSSADVCIIGSGITGVSTAYHLAKSFNAGEADDELKVVILEARDFCSGATGRNGGHLTPGIFLGFSDRVDAYDTDYALRSLALENHTAGEIIDFISRHGLEHAVDLVEGGHFTIFTDKKSLVTAKSDYVLAAKAGTDLSAVTWYTEEEMKQQFGIPFPGVHFPGYNLWPLKFVTHLFTHARDMNPKLALSLHTNTPVTAIHKLESSSTYRSLLDTPRGSIRCRSVVHATNAYASYLLPFLSDLHPIIPTRGQMAAVRSSVSLQNLTRMSWSGWSVSDSVYWFPRPVENESDNPLVLIGGKRNTSPTRETWQQDDSALNVDISNDLNDFLPTIFPGKFEVGRKAEMEWTGIMGYTTSGDPFVGPVIDPSGELPPGQFISAGYTGHGMPRAFSCAEILARMLLAQIAGSSWTVPDWLPKQYLTENW